MSVLDHFLVFLYITALYLITWFTLQKDRNVKSTNLTEKKTAEKHFLASRSIGVVEAVFSIVATEFSALTFVQLPALVLLGKSGLLWGGVGVVLGRYLISNFLLKNFYRSGLTVFDSLARGVNNYTEITQSTRRAQRMMASIYFFSKILSVSSAVYLGVTFISLFYELDFTLVLILVIFLTAIYTIVGGLKVVMRTDILQFWAIVLGGIVLVFMTAEKIEDYSFAQIIPTIKNASLGSASFSSIFIGIFTGLITDFSTHGVEQEFVQKLKACKTPTVASRAVVLSTFLTVGLQALFILIGSIFLLKNPTFTGEITDSIKFFMKETINYLNSGSKGLVVVAILAATMSSLDSALNALSTVLWNDILPPSRFIRYPLLIKIDNIVVVFFVCLFSFFVAQNPMYIKGFFSLNFYILLPLVCCFVIRFACYPWIRFPFHLHSVIFIILSCFLGLILNSIYFNFPSVIAVFICILLSILTIWFYGELKKWI